MQTTIKQLSQNPSLVTTPSFDQQSWLDRSAQLRHDMANTIGAMQVRLYVLKKTEVLNNDQLQGLELCTSRLRALLDSWRQLEADVQEGDGPTVETFDLCTLAAQVLDMYHPLIHSKKQRLIFSARPGTTNVTGEKLKYARVLDNLISNACKYTLIGGIIQVGVAHESGHIVITVADNGIGIHEQEMPRIFKCYFRGRTALQRKIEGTGLGLNIVSQIVDDLGGQITVQSAVDAGSRFVVTLPAPA